MYTLLETIKNTSPAWRGVDENFTAHLPETKL
jgi:hypothetical protein